jgi:hypothetical protein
MTRPIDLLRQGKKQELWQMCCGFIDLSIEQFMAIQKRLLLEQITLLKNCELGRKVMRGAMPETVDEFREQVPLTTYGDYLPELGEKREDVLPGKPAGWIRTSGYTGKYDVKWIPISEEFNKEFQQLATGVLLLTLCDGRGDTSKIKEHLKMLYTVGTLEYASGYMVDLTQKAVGFDFLPSNGEGMSFQEKIRAGFAEALYEGLDGFGGLPSVLVAVGEQLKKQSGSISIRSLLSHPNAVIRVTRGLVKSKLARRPLLPKDLWSIKFIGGGGTDCAIFGERVKELWGRYPLEAYAGTEGGVYATQTWDHEGMTFVPNINFFEFIPEREFLKWRLDNSYQPKTILLDEVKAGENYEIVITNLHGGILTRYRVGDVIRITSLRNEKLNIDLPQMVFHSRADDLIDIAGFGRLTERIIWEAIDSTGISYTDWTARKEIIRDTAVLHIYLELKSDCIASEKALTATLCEQFKKLDSKYHYNIYGNVFGDTESSITLAPVEVTFLPQGAFASYTAQRQAEGADLGHLKPPHINPSDKVLSSLGAPEVLVEAVPVTEGERAAAR